MFLPAIRLRHLRAFVAAAQRESVVKASADLAVTQPAVSKSIRELEAILGTELLTRNRRGPFLSPSGRLFLRHAEACLAELRRGMEELESGDHADSVPIRIGALPTVSARLLPQAIRRYVAGESGPVPRIVTGPTGYLMTQLHEGGLDIVLGRMGEPEEMTGFVFEHLYSEPIAFIVRQGHPLLGRDVSGEDIASGECLLPPPGSVIRPTVDRFFAAANLRRPARVIETVSLAFSRTYVLSGDAIWVISEGVVLDDIRSGLLARLRLATEDTKGPVGITLKAGVLLPPKADLLLVHLRDVAAEIRDRSRA